MIVRAGAGFLVALVIVVLARRARALSRSGAGAAVVLGTLCVTAGWRWGALLILFFVASSALSRHRVNTKEDLTAPILAKGGERDAMQVLANGGLFGMAALLSLVAPESPSWIALGTGALAAATSDTWGTEIGTLARRPPRSIVSWRQVPPGTSGGVSLPGTIASVLGAAFIALCTALLWSRGSVAAAAFVGGVAGSTADSVIGATLQCRRRCTGCGATTERVIHDCGAVTEVAGGLAWLDNDRVNLLSGLIGAVVGLAVGR